MLRGEVSCRETYRRKVTRMGFHEQAFDALRKRPGVPHCIQCWADAASLTSPEDQRRLSQLARTLAAPTDPMSGIGNCEVYHKKQGVRVVRALEPTG